MVSLAPETRGLRGVRPRAGAVANEHVLIARFPDSAGYRHNNRPLQRLTGRVVAAVRAVAGGGGVRVEKEQRDGDG
jgi:hypothetical protein